MVIVNLCHFFAQVTETVIFRINLYVDRLYLDRLCFCCNPNELSLDEVRVL